LHPAAKQEHDIAAQFQAFREQYDTDQQDNRRLLTRVLEEMFGDGTPEKPGMRAEMRVNSDFRTSIENGYSWVRRIGYGLVVLSGAIAAWWGALHRKP
jgi:hypothetical protein